MAEKKIIIDIDAQGGINAETFGLVGTECIDELDKLMKNMAMTGTTIKKPEFYEQRTQINSTVTNKND